MDHRFLALIAALCFSGSASALNYVNTTPPAGWAAGGGAGGSVTGTKASVNALFNPSGMSTSASINMGRRVDLPASIRWSPNASRIAASAVMLHPGVRTVSTVAAWLVAAGLVYDVSSGLWTSPPSDLVPSDGFLYYYNWSGSRYPSVSEACSAYAATLVYDLRRSINHSSSGNRCHVTWQQVSYPGANDWSPRETTVTINSVPSACPVGWYVTPAGCVQTPQPVTVTPEQAIERLIEHPMPADVPQHIPEPLPIEIPQIQPTFIPTGDPVPNPKFDPEQAPSPTNPPKIQPGVEARPAPTASNPWQVSLNPVNKPVTDPTATPERNPTPIPDGSGSGTIPPNQPQENADFCARNPTVLACQTLEHEPDDTKLPTKAIEFEFEPYNGFSGVKSCPAFPTTSHILMGHQVTWDSFCETLDKLSHLLLAFAWVSAAFIILGYGRE